MAPYFASAFGTFLMRQTFRAIPRDFEEAALHRRRAVVATLIWHVLLPMARPGLIAFAIVSVTAHWNEFLWPLMVINVAAQPDAHRSASPPSPRARRAARNGACWPPARCWSMAPLLLAFVAFQRRFVDSFMFTGVKG